MSWFDHSHGELALAVRLEARHVLTQGGAVVGASGRKAPTGRHSSHESQLEQTVQASDFDGCVRERVSTTRAATRRSAK